MKPLTAQQKNDFQEQGYLLLKKAIPHVMCDRVNGYMRAARDGTRRVSYTSPADGDKSINRSHQYEPIMMNLAKHPPIPSVLQSLLGYDATICQSLYMFRALKNQPTRIEFFLPPKSGPLVVVWMALQDVGVEDGAFSTIPGSHLGPVVLGQDLDGHWWHDDQVKKEYYARIAELVGNSQLIPLEMAKGDILFFNGRLIHTAIKHRRTRTETAFLCLPLSSRRCRVGHEQ